MQKPGVKWQYVLSLKQVNVVTKNIVVNDGTNNSKLDVTNLANGIYGVKMQADGVLQTAKLVMIK